jgi:hypothetical protein
MYLSQIEKRLHETFGKNKNLFQCRNLFAQLFILIF